MNGPTRILLVIAAVILSLIFLSMYAFYAGIFSNQALQESTLLSYSSETTMSFSPVSIEQTAPGTVKYQSGYYHFTVDVIGTVNGPLTSYWVIPFVTNGSYSLNTAVPTNQNSSIDVSTTTQVYQEYIPQTSQFFSFKLEAYQVDNGQPFNLTATLFKGEIVVLWVMTYYQGKYYRIAISYLSPEDSSISNVSNGLSLCTNIYELNGAGGTLESGGSTTTLSAGTLIVVPNGGLPELVIGPYYVNLPPGTKVNGQLLPSGGVLFVDNGGELVQECNNLAYLPVTSFMDLVLGHNTWIGTIEGEPYYPSDLGSQSISQWIYLHASSRSLNQLKSPSLPEIVIVNSTAPSLLDASSNTVYWSEYAPTGGYVLWSGNSGLIVGGGPALYSPTPLTPSKSSGIYSVAYTVEVASGEWLTIVDPDSLNGLTLNLLTGVYNSQTGFVGLYVNGTLVSHAHIEPQQLNPVNSYADSGSVTGKSSGGTLFTCLSTLPGGTTSSANNPASLSYTYSGYLGNSYVYQDALDQQEVESIFKGLLPDISNLQVLWDQGLLLNANPTPEVPNLVNENQFNAYFGGTEASQPSLNTLPIIWAGGNPINLNNPALQGTNITFTIQGYIKPQVSGKTSFEPLLQMIGSNRAENYTDEYLQVYMNGTNVYSASLVNNNLEAPSSTFSYDLTYPTNLTIKFTFTVNSNEGVFLGMLWEPPGQNSFNYIPVTSYNAVV